MKLITSMLTVAILGSSTLSLVTIKGEAAETSNQAVSSIDVDVNSEMSSEDMIQMLKELEESGFGEVTIDGDSFTLEFSDSELAQKIGLPSPRGVGRNGIQGKLTSGNFKIYLTKYSINTLRGLGIGSIGKFIPGLPGWLIQSLGTLIAAHGTVSHGRVYVYSGVRYQYYYNQ